MILRKARDQPRTTREDLLNDLKRAGTTVSTITINNTLHRHELKPCSARKVPLLKPAYVQAHLYISGSGSKFNYAARVGSADLGYWTIFFNFKPVQTSRFAVSDPLPEPPALLQQNTLLLIWNILMWVLWHKWGTKIC